MIGVIIPVYNVEGYLRRCIDSILTQSLQDFMLILVDDGSTDNSPMICDEYKEKHKNIEVIHKKNGGLSDARNMGLDYALQMPTIDWITFIDSDDWIHPQYLECLYIACQKNDTDISVARFQRVKEFCNEKYLNFTDVVATICNPEDYWLMPDACPRIACIKLYKKELWANMRFPVGKVHEDEATIYRILFAMDKIAVLDVELYFYYSNPFSITSGDGSFRHQCKVEFLKEQKSFFKRQHYERAYARAVGFYLFFLDETVRHLRKKGCYSFRYIQFLWELKVALLEYWLFERKLGLKTDDFANTAFPIASRIYHGISRRLRRL